MCSGGTQIRLGGVLCKSHKCHYCDSEVDALDTHGLSCKHSEGRHYRHSAINDIIHRASSAAKVPSRLDPYFQPVVVETAGVIGPDTLKFLKTLGRRIREASGEGKSFPYLIQCLAVAIQRGNAASVRGTSEDFSL